MRKFVVPWLELLNGLGALIAIVVFVVDIFNENRTLYGYVSAGAIIFLVLLLIAYAWLSARRQRYQAISRHLQGIAQRCRISRNRISQGDEILEVNSKFRDDLGVIMNHVAELFVVLTQRPCRAAIKSFRPADFTNDWYVVTLARDHASAESHKHGDRRRAEEEFDTLDKNPHLLSLFSDDVDSEDWECFNNVPKLIKEGRYASSSLLWAMKVSHSMGGGMAAHRLSYRSALVALVRNKNDEAIAFIGVDTSAPNAFRAEIDGPLLTAIGGYIGPLLDDAFAALPDPYSEESEP